MANELVHASQGTELSQSEFESVTAHILNSQATGDIIYASSASQLSRLTIGNNNALLGISAGIPAWITNPLPVSDNGYDLGSSTVFWRWLYICGALTGASGGVDFGRWAKISREGDDNISIFTRSAASAFVERMRFGSGAAQGSSSITLYEPFTTAILSNIFTTAVTGNNIFYQMRATAAGFGGAGNIHGFNWYDGTDVNAAIGASYNSGLGTTEIIFHSIWNGGYTTTRMFTFRGNGSILVGLAGTMAGSIGLSGVTSGVVTVAVAAAAGTWTMTLPTGVAAVGGYQLTDAAGNGICSWTAAGSRREWKNLLGKQFAISPSEALDSILGTKVYPFRYKKGFGTGDYDTCYQGVMADESPWAMHFDGNILNPISTHGYTVLAFQALNTKTELSIQALEGQILNLRQEVFSLRQSLIGKGG